MRLELVRRARGFKRTWVDMAEALVRVRNRGLYRDWGFSDFHAYCEVELQLKRATVDKLTGSYVAIERHAPRVLDRDGLAQSIPGMDCVDYFARALAEPEAMPQKHRTQRAAPPPPEVVEDLRKAVFEEGLPVAQLRKKFDPILKPKTDDEARLEQLHKTSAAVRKLMQFLEVAEFIGDDRRKQLIADLEELGAELDAMAPSMAQAKSA